MPVYRKISLDELASWLSDLNKLVMRIYNYPTKSSILYFVVSLYEYIQVLSKLKILGVVEAENIKITVKDIKSYVNNDDKLLSVINSFKTLRDDASHGFVSDNRFTKSYIKVLCSDDFIFLLDSLNLDADLTRLIKLVTKRLKICFTKEYKSNCLKDCRDMLSVDESYGRSRYTVLEVVNKLRSKYDLCTLQNSIISILSNEYVV